jgi:hypothetical protein
VWSTVIDNIRREVRGNQFTAEITKTATHPVSDAATEVRLGPGAAEQLIIIGEDRADIASELQIWSNGYDETEAKSLAGQVVLRTNQAGTGASFSVQYPQPGSQRAKLILKAPSRLRVQVTRAGRSQSISGVAAVEADDLRGETTIRRIAGRVSGSHRAGDLVIDDVGSVKLATRGSDARIERVRGELSLETQSGELRGGALLGPIEIEANDTEIALERLEKVRGTIRVNASGGRVVLRGIASETRVDARHAEVEAALASPAAVTIQSDNEDVEITPPPGGFTLDAVATEGRIEAPPGTIAVEAGEREQRAAGDVQGGGAVLSVRVTHGDLRLRARAADAPLER